MDGLSYKTETTKLTEEINMLIDTIKKTQTPLPTTSKMQSYKTSHVYSLHKKIKEQEEEEQQQQQKGTPERPPNNQTERRRTDTTNGSGKNTSTCTLNPSQLYTGNSTLSQENSDPYCEKSILSPLDHWTTIIDNTGIVRCPPWSSN